MVVAEDQINEAIEEQLRLNAGNSTLNFQRKSRRPGLASLVELNGELRSKKQFIPVRNNSDFDEILTIFEQFQRQSEALLEKNDKKYAVTSAAFEKRYNEHAEHKFDQQIYLQNHQRQRQDTHQKLVQVQQTLHSSQQKRREIELRRLESFVERAGDFAFGEGSCNLEKSIEAYEKAIECINSALGQYQ